MLKLILACAALAGSSARLILPSTKTVSEWTAPDFCRGKECPRFYNATKDTPYEVRDYKKSTWALYTVEGSGFVVAEGKAYTQLTRYFKGANVHDAQIDLTTPATTAFIPTDEDFSGSENNYTVAFYLPDQAPKPQVDGVYLETFPATTIYVRSFGGYATESTILQEAKTLRDQLLHDKVDIEEEDFLFSTYDSAARLFDRHNEVWFKAGVRGPFQVAQGAADVATTQAGNLVDTLYHKVKTLLG